jgi:predicted house-cleaning noncanonical NTP pyrophosphatase (MazG superfamily)
MKMRTFRLNKLVRDKIVADHIAEGAVVGHHRLSKEQKRKELLNKIIEEAQECLKTDEILSELADIQEALDQLAKDSGLTKQQISTKKSEKRAKNGGFKNGDYIGLESWPVNHKWAKYYAADPKTFPEVR